MTDSSLNGFTIFFTAFVGAFLILLWKFFSEEKNQTKEKECSEVGDGEPSSKTKKNEAKKSNKTKSLKSARRKEPANTFTHDMLHTTLKGHTGDISCLEMSLNGKYLASCSDDQTIRLWKVKDFGNGNTSVRVNVEFDSAKLIRFSPDNRAFIAGLSGGNTVRVYKVGKKDDGVTTTCTPLEDDFPQYHEANLLNVGIGATSSGGCYVMTAYENDTIVVRDLKGNPLHTINTNQNGNCCAWVSPCGRFVASSGWTPDVKVWSVNFDKQGEFKDVRDAFVLEGHTSSVWSFAFNLDSTRMVSVCKDGMWRLYETNGQLSDDTAYLMSKGHVTLLNASVKQHPATCALSSDGKVAAVACLNNIAVFSTTTGEVEMEINECHSEIISSLVFDIGGKYLLSSGDRFVRVFHNTLHYKEKIRSLEESLSQQKKKIPSAMRERQEAQVEECKKALDQIYLSHNKS